eukprot:8989055-Heterocapsa_arctica.AAC.1
MVFSAGDDYIAIAVYMPEEKQHDRSCEEWLKKIVDFFPCYEMVVVDKDVSIAKIMWTNDMNANLFKNVGLRIEK